jgi:pimeloyl-ACP methyl ester carboxylesterase
VAAAVNPFVDDELAPLRAEHAHGEQPYGDMPLVVIVRGRPEEDGGGPALEAQRTREYTALASLSRAGTIVVADRSGHHVQLEDPELVVSAIRRAIAAAPK